MDPWNGFTISKNKTVAMHFCSDKKCTDPVVKLYNDPIEFVKEAKFLGLIWLQNLPLNLILNTSKHGVKNHWISSKSFHVQNGVQINQLYWNYIAPWLDQNWIMVV